MTWASRHDDHHDTKPGARLEPGDVISIVASENYGLSDDSEPSGGDVDLPNPCHHSQRC